MRARSVVESFAARSGETTEEKSEDGEQLQDFMSSTWKRPRRDLPSGLQDSHRQGVAEVMYERAPPGLRMHLAPREARAARATFVHCPLSCHLDGCQSNLGF